MLDQHFGIVHKPLELFSHSFIKKFAEEILCHKYCDRGDITGEDWEKIFAACIDVPWKKKHAFYDIEDNKTLTAWSAKTIFYEKGNTVNLISGRNSPLETFNEQFNPKTDDPKLVGESILKIWNDRVLSVKKVFNDFKTIVLLRNKKLTEFRIFYYDTELYDHTNYIWKWSNNHNLHGLNKDCQMSFLWQPKGSQFTIMKRIPSEVQLISVKSLGPITKEKILKVINFSEMDYTSYYG